MERVFGTKLASKSGHVWQPRSSGGIDVTSRWTGIGDLVFLTASFHEYHKRTGETIRLNLKRDNGHERVLENIPFVDLVYCSEFPSQLIQAGISAFRPDRLPNLAIEYTYNVLNIADTPIEDRLLRLCLTDQERKYGADYRNLFGRPVVGIGVSGSKPYKRIRRAKEIADSLLDIGIKPVILKLPSDEIAFGHDCFYGQNAREMLSFISGLDGWIGLDSGPTWCAIALEVPTVMLYGPIDVSQILSRTGHKFIRTLAVHNADDCQAKFGLACDHVRFDTRCPFTANGGAQCIDLLPTQRILSALADVMQEKVDIGGSI